MTGSAAGDFPRHVLNTRVAALKAAQRHTKHVRVLRIALPVCAGLLLASIAAAIVFDPRAMLAEVDAESLGITGTKIVMEWPKFTGYQIDSTGAAKNYEVVASRAEQSISKPDEIDLFDLKGKMEMRKEGWTRIAATRGHLTRAKQILNLSQSIGITTDLGDRADLTGAKINFASGEIMSSKPVSIRFQRADLDADTMHLFDTGNRAIFTGRVVMTLKPDPAQPVAPHAIEGLR
jgi:lipopolysaccharide export system protein LptC